MGDGRLPEVPVRQSKEEARAVFPPALPRGPRGQELEARGLVPSRAAIGLRLRFEALGGETAGLSGAKGVLLVLCIMKVVPRGL